MKYGKSINCPNCNTKFNSIETDRYLTKWNVIMEDEDSISYQRKLVETCYCLECDKDYTVDGKYDTYIIYKKPYKRSKIDDIELLAECISDFSKDFKIYSYRIDGRKNTFVKIENDDYPYILDYNFTKGVEFNWRELDEIERARTYSYSMWLSRNKK